MPEGFNFGYITGLFQVYSFVLYLKIKYVYIELRGQVRGLEGEGQVWTNL
jgi:hypothetical protein